MEFKKNSGNIYFFNTNKTENPKNCFTSPLEIRSNFNKLNSIKIISNKAIGITSNNELFQWEEDKKEQIDSNQKDKNNFLFLTSKPLYKFRKIKFKSITLNKTVCLGLEINGNVLVWGQSTEGTLGLGYDITNVDEPTLLEDLKDIIQISLSDHHAIAINSSGCAYSWGTGKYGELGLERSIYSPVPQQILTDTCYSKVFCGNLVSCFLDNEGHFYYFGVVIKQLIGSGSTVTTKSLLDEQIYNDGKILFLEKQIEELENKKFNNIVIGNGFIVLLTTEGAIFTLEYNDKLTRLYSKYYLYNISVAKNNIFGLAKEQKNNNNKYNYYLIKWTSSYLSEKDLYSDSWHTTIWKFIDDYNIMENCELLDTNIGKDIVFLKVLNINENDNILNNTILEDKKGDLELMKNEIANQLDNSVNINANINIGEDIYLNSNHNKIFKDKFLEYESEYDDSYNLKYKRNQSNTNVLFQDGKTSFMSNYNYNSFYSYNKNISFSPNTNMNKTVIFKNKSNNPLYINNRNNANLESMAMKLNKNTIKGNSIYNSNYEFEKYKNKNDISDNVNIDIMDDNNKSNTIYNYKNNKNRKKKNNKNGNNTKIDDEYEYNSDENEFKEKELSKYRAEVDNIINNFRQKKKSQSFSVIGRGNKKDITNNLNILGKEKDDSSYDNNLDSQNQRYSIPISLSNKKSLGKSKYKKSSTPNNYNSNLNHNNYNNDNYNNDNEKTISINNNNLPLKNSKNNRNRNKNKNKYLENNEENESIEDKDNNDYFDNYNENNKNNKNKNINKKNILPKKQGILKIKN